MKRLEDVRKGLCLNCWTVKAPCNPEARNYECSECGAHSVFGTLVLILEGAKRIDELSAKRGGGNK